MLAGDNLTLKLILVDMQKDTIEAKLISEINIKKYALALHMPK